MNEIIKIIREPVLWILFFGWIIFLWFVGPFLFSESSNIFVAIGAITGLALFWVTFEFFVDFIINKD